MGELLPSHELLEQLNQLQFGIFLGYVRDFSEQTGWKGIAFNNDSHFDSSKIENSRETQALVTAHGFLYLGEAQIEEGYFDDILANMSQVPPDIFTFIPYPGGQGEQVRDDPGAREIIREMRARR